MDLLTPKETKTSMVGQSVSNIKKSKKEKAKNLEKSIQSLHEN
jgi:hypothetical protein